MCFELNLSKRHFVRNVGLLMGEVVIVMLVAVYWSWRGYRGASIIVCDSNKFIDASTCGPPSLKYMDVNDEECSHSE